MKLKLPTIPSHDFFERWYLPVFGTLCALITILALLVFYITTRPPKLSEEPGNPSKDFNESIILKINELLDLRADYFDKIRKLKPDIKNPF